MTHNTHLVHTGPVPRWVARTHKKLATRAVNFVPMSWDEAAQEPHWHIDQKVVLLPSEEPGPPLPDGPYARARKLLETYEVADPSMVRAVYDPTAPLDGRDMLLVGRLCGLRFPMGVRIGGVHDGPDVLDGWPVHRFGWHYRTLEGHLERGQMNYEVVKYLTDGRVEFRMAAYSQRGVISNPVTLLGFLMFGRWLQLRFYRRAAARMATLTAERITATEA